MKKMLSLVLSILLLLSLPSCRKDEEPPAPSDDLSGQTSRFADTNIEDRYHMAIGGLHAGFVYGSKFYYSNGGCAIVSVPLPTGGATETSQKSEAVCPDSLCEHWGISAWGETIEEKCPAYMFDPEAIFLLDATESGGDQPVFYYARCIADNITFDDKWSSGQEYEIVRYDTAEGIAEVVTSLNYPITQLMTYKDRIYFIAQTKVDRFELHTVGKSGGEVTTLSPGDSYINLIGANEGGVYVNDEKGNVYALGLDFSTEELIYTVEDVYPLNTRHPGNLEMFIDGEYLYFYADFEVKIYPYDDEDPEWYKLIEHSIRRVRTDDPVGDGEVVAENVFEESVYGVYKGVLYYGPFDVTTEIRTKQNQVEASNICCSGGTIKGVKLDTLETFDVITDSGYNYESGPFYISDRCIIATATPYRDGMGIAHNTSGFFPSLLDFETGALYNTHSATRLYDGTIND